ncbi:MAG: hypothetical protein JNM56_31180 [Planctomycetia bacterium]|nr:hypothetical protein [Planctomycetia bacterium]
MRRLTLLSLTLLCTGLTALPAAPPDLKGKTLRQTFEELLPNLAAKNDAQQQWQNLCFQLGAPGNEALRAEACQLMAGKLDAATPSPARVWLLRQLERIGREECVAAVAAVLDDKDEPVRDAAVRCLANNPAATATGKLTERLPKAAGRTKVGLLNALAHRGDASATAAVAKELVSDDVAAGNAAARALGRFATPEAAQVLAAARTKAMAEVRPAIADAWLQCADRRLKEGKAADALAIYQALHKPDEPRPIRLAALQGVLRSVGDQAGAMTLDILGGTDADARAIAVGQIENLNAKALQTLAASSDKLPAASQVLVLTALAARGDRSQLPVALAAAKSADARIKQAGIQALGRLGDASVVELLLENLFAASALSGPAADSLVQLAADGVNDKLLAALAAEKSPARLSALIGVVERRKVAGAAPVLLQAARGDDAGVRASAFAGLKALAEPKHVPEMVLALLKTEKGKERADAELAIVTVCAQIPEPAKRADALLALLKDGAKGQRADLLPLLGRLGGPAALPVVQEALADSNPALHEAGVAALCNWPDAMASEELLKLAKNAKEPARRQQALRAAIRVNTILSSDRTDADKLASLAALKQAMELADRDDERKLLLENIGFVRVLDTLRYVLPYLDHKDLNQQACKAVVELAHSRPLREPNKAEFDKALDRVLALCKDKTLLDRARQYKLGQ